MIKVIQILVVLMLILLFIWGGHYLQRSVNWSWGYEDMVEEKIKQMVKPEALKEAAGD